MLKKQEFHDGIDIACPKGTEVIAVSDGKVTAVGYSSTYGNYIKYKTNDGYTIMYAHLQKSLVNTDDTVKANQKMALSGNSGMTTGAHLHYGIWKNETPVDAMTFVSLPYTEEVTAEYTKRGVAMK